MVYSDRLWCGVGFVLQQYWDWLKCNLNPESCSAGETARSPFTGTGAVWGHNPREVAASRRKKLPGAGSWGSERPRRVRNWGFPWQQPRGVAKVKREGKGQKMLGRGSRRSWWTVPRGGAGSRRSTWPWGHDLMPYWGCAESWGRLAGGAWEEADAWRWICRATKGVKALIVEDSGAGHATEQRAESSCDAHLSPGVGPRVASLLKACSGGKLQLYLWEKYCPLRKNLNIKGKSTLYITWY